MNINKQIEEFEKEINKLSSGCGEWGCPYTLENNNKIYEEECLCDNCNIIIGNKEEKLQILKQTRKELNEEIENQRLKYRKVGSIKEQDLCVVLKKRLGI